MKTKRTEDIDGSEIIAQDIISDSNIMLIPKGSRLKKEYIGSLLGLGIETVLVEISAKEEVEADEDIIQSEDETDTIPYEIMEYYTSYVRKIIENYQKGQPDLLREIEIVAENIVGYCRKNMEKKIPVNHRNQGDICQHMVYVTMISLKIAIALNYTTLKLFQIAMGCLLHDLGLYLIKVNVVNQDYHELTPGEIFEFKKHTIYGFMEVETIDWIAGAAKDLILSHHERLDGEGYPLRRKKQCPQCRIIQAADGFDCMLSGVESEQYEVSEALDLMKRDAGRKYDAEILGYLQDCIAKF